MNRVLQARIYFALDYLAAALAWTLFYVYRKVYVEPPRFGNTEPVLEFGQTYWLSVLLIPLCWTIIYYLSGTYRVIYLRSRLREVVATLITSFLGSTALFFALLLNDFVGSPEVFRYTFTVLFLSHFLITATFRLIYLTFLKKQIRKGVLGVNTVIAGAGAQAWELFEEVRRENPEQGYRFIGFVGINGGQVDPRLQQELPMLGHYSELPELIDAHGVQTLMLAVETHEHKRVDEILNTVEYKDISVKIRPGMHEIITGMVRFNYIFGTPLVELRHSPMPEWQQSVKRLMDIVFSLMVLVVGSPLYIALAIGVRFSSKGPVFYRQERLGYRAVPFKIIKFRSMYVDAEYAGPALSSKDDPRITRFGRILRKYRLDEFPQFYNVLIGEMSLVGPRPERQYFIEKIMKQAPHYKLLHRVRPGITSWGQVKYGYAENIDQMLQRMRFDTLYVENMSLGLDFKILFYTVVIIFQGRGK